MLVLSRARGKKIIFTKANSVVTTLEVTNVCIERGEVMLEINTGSEKMLQDKVVCKSFPEDSIATGLIDMLPLEESGAPALDD